MNYIKAKFPNSTRSYVYRTEDYVKAGETVVNAKGAKLTVTDETVDMKWVETYGADKMAVVKKYEEYRIVDIRDAKTRITRSDGRYPLRIGRITKKPNPHIGLPMILEYVRNADGTDYSGNILRTSRVCGSFINEKGNLVVETTNSVYEFELVKNAESEE